MKKEVIRFDEYPFQVPTEAKFKKAIEPLLEELKNASSLQETKKIIKKVTKFSAKLENQLTTISVKYTLDTTNPKYRKAQEKTDELRPLFSNYFNEYKKLLLNSPFRKELEEAYGSYLFKMYEISLKAFDEKIIPELIQDNKLVSEYDEIMGGAQIEFRGETLNLSQLGKHLSSTNREERKEAAVAFDKWLGEHDAAIGEIYDKMVKVRHKMALELGYDNFIPLGYLLMGRTDYTAKEVEGYRKQIASEIVPVAQKLYKEQAKMLGIKNPQYYDYNLRFKSGNAKPLGDEKVLVEAAKEMYHEISPETDEFFNFMINHNLMDLTARKGKQPGGYCTFFPSYKSPFIFSNFNGTEGDVNVLCHEGGHAFQAYLCANFKIPEYMSPTLESCEIHSMSMEFFTWPYMDKFFDDSDKYRYSHLCDAIEFLPYGITVDEFQHWVYANPNATHEERCAKWKEIESRYTPHKKYDECPTLNAGRYWLRQGHIFSSPFYYIDYTLAQVVAFQFLIEDRKNHQRAWKKYLKMSKCGGKYPFTELLRRNGLRNPFEDGNVKKVIGPLKKILASFDTSKF